MAIIIWFRLLYLALVDPVLYSKQADIQRVNETMVMDVADLAVNISSNSADLKANDLHISDIQVSTYNGYYYWVYVIVSCPG